jgi:hypothetical protein
MTVERGFASPAALLAPAPGPTACLFESLTATLDGDSDPVPRMDPRMTPFPQRT